MRNFTPQELELLNSPNIDVRLLVKFNLDSGDYYFCDDNVDFTYQGQTYIGAAALGDSIEVQSGRDLAAEPVTLEVDGNRMVQYGISDPASILSEMLQELTTQRRVDFWLGIFPVGEIEIQLRIPLYVGKINSVRLIDPEIAEDNDEPGEAKLEIQLDSIASRYRRQTFRVRSDADQREIDPTDAFFAFVSDSINNERTLYWGRRAPFSGRVGSGGGSGSGRFGSSVINPHVSFL